MYGIKTGITLNEAMAIEAEQSGNWESARIAYSNAAMEARKLSNWREHSRLSAKAKEMWGMQIAGVNIDD